MAKVVSMRERVHQPFWDSLVRTAGMVPGAINDVTSLFTSGGARTEATTNLINGSTLPSDQSHVVLALRVFAWYRNPHRRVLGNAGTNEVAVNGDYLRLAPWLNGGAAEGDAPGSVQDYYRLIHQTEEQLHWNFGTGLKNSIFNMPTWYFPAGGGISGDMGGTTDLIHWQNSGTDGHSGILRLARAVLIPPRQNILCEAKIFQLPDGGQAAAFGTTTATGRNMLSLKDNLNAVDMVSKCVTFCFDGLFSRDVQ